MLIRNEYKKEQRSTVNKVVPSQAPQNPQVPIGEGTMTNDKITSVIHILTLTWATQGDRGARVSVNPNVITTASRIRYFTCMNPSTFYGSMEEEDPQGFIDEVFKVIDAMGVFLKKRRN